MWDGKLFVTDKTNNYIRRLGIWCIYHRDNNHTGVKKMGMFPLNILPVSEFMYQNESFATLRHHTLYLEIWCLTSRILHRWGHRNILFLPLQIKKSSNTNDVLSSRFNPSKYLRAVEEPLWCSRHLSNPLEDTTRSLFTRHRKFVYVLFFMLYILVIISKKRRVGCGMIDRIPVAHAKMLIIFMLWK